MAESDWSVFERTASPTSTVEERVEELALTYSELAIKRKEIDEQMQQISAEIAHYAPETSTEHVFNTPRCEVSVTRTERWSWDQNQLLEILGADETTWPDHVKKNVSVDKRKFQKLSAQEQERLKPALTRKLDPAKVKVTVDV
jgi:hypothetical protein